MAEGKKGFILYADQKEIFEQLSNVKAGELIKHIFRYVNDEYPESKDMVINLAFTPIKQQLKRDLKKYENICERNKLNGAKGGRPKNQNKPKKPNGLSGNPNKPKKPDTDNDIDKEKDIVIDKEKNNYSFFTNEFSKVWNEYLLMRKKIKKPATVKAEKLALEKVNEYSGGDEYKAIKIVENSVLNSWQGIFELKTKDKQINDW